MLKSLEIRGYRGFSSYRMSDLARVNLVVGKNNCGKTSILEAIEVLVTGGDPLVISRLDRRRQEVGSQFRPRIPVSATMDLSHVFHGHSFDVGSSFHLRSSDGARSVTVEVLAIEEADEEFHLQNSEQEEDSAPAFAFVLKIDSSALKEPITLPMLEDGAVVFNRHRAALRDRFSGLPTRFLTVDSFDPAKMGESWNTALANSLEGEIVDDMKILVPSLNSIHFLTGSPFGRGILLDFANGARRMPISTFGDGLRRLLALRLSFVGTANGFLLADEIDTGLHWTVMEEMWRFVVEVARKNNVQVFATTHSYDCIRGLASLIRSRADLADEVCIQKVVPSLDRAVCLKGEQVKVAIEQDIEVR